MKKTFISFVMFTLISILIAGIASAHVVVFPKEAIQGSYEKFTIRVPTEQDTPTVKVEVKIPETVDISRTMPLAGWKSEFTKDTNGKVISVIWTSTAEGLSPTEFGEFNMQGKVDSAAASIVWKATQTYKDGSVVEWAGDDKSKHPAAITKIIKAPADASVAADGDVVTTTKTTFNLPLSLSIAAVIVSLLSLFVAIKRKAR
jgi:uncharacterized protein YcnI